MSAPARTPMGAKKPIPAAVKPQQKKPIPAAVRPQTNAKKPIPAAVRPQARPAASKPPPTNNIATKTGSVTPRAPASNAVSRAPAANKPSAPSAGGQGAAQAPSMGNWINRTVQNSVAGVGNYAGGFVNSIADSVNKVGDGVGASITSTTRYWGQGVAGYGNNIKDSVGIGGARVSTAGNPLGIAGMGAGQAAAPGKAAQQGVRAGGAGSGGNHLGI
ncbi:hypothetical protein LTR75_011804 [Friedmanniomyces endolithicus]|nr:hypothetical protein LTR75_011804 [Friedmanniomyces endolithicus]